MRFGSYRGDGTANRIIDIGFTPKVLWIYPTEIDYHEGKAAVATSSQHSVNPIELSWLTADIFFQGIVPNGFMTGTSETGEGTNINVQNYLWIASP